MSPSLVPSPLLSRPYSIYTEEVEWTEEEHHTGRSNEHPFEWQDNPKWTKYFDGKLKHIEVFLDFVLT